eukprot:3046601-Pleurochrysis_carterae.AAC.1
MSSNHVKHCLHSQIHSEKPNTLLYQVLSLSHRAAPQPLQPLHPYLSVLCDERTRRAAGLLARSERGRRARRRRGPARAPRAAAAAWQSAAQPKAALDPAAAHVGAHDAPARHTAQPLDAAGAKTHTEAGTASLARSSCLVSVQRPVLPGRRKSRTL